MVWALSQLSTWLAKEIVGLLEDGVSAATLSITSALSELASDESSAANGLAWSYAQGHAAQGNATSALLDFLTPLLVGGAIIGIAVSVALTLLTPFTLGISFLLPLLVPIVMDAFGLSQKLSMPSTREQSQAGGVAGQNSGGSTTSLISAVEAGFDSFESPHTSGQIQPAGWQASGDWIGYVIGAALTAESAVMALIAGSIVSGSWGPAAGWAGFILSLIALCFLLPLSIQQYGNLPQSYSPSDASQFRQLQVTDIELVFFAFSGVVLSVAGLLFSTGPAQVLGGRGAVVGILGAVLAMIQLWEVQAGIDG
jgi:hypothetical protein